MSFDDLPAEDADDILEGRIKALMERYPDHDQLRQVLGNPFAYWAKMSHPESVLAAYLSGFSTGSSIDPSLYHQAIAHDRYAPGLRLLLACTQRPYFLGLEFMGEPLLEVVKKNITSCKEVFAVLIEYLSRTPGSS